MLCYSVDSSPKNKFSILKSNRLYYPVEKFCVCTVSMLSCNTVHFFCSHWASLSSSAFPKHSRKLHGPIFINSFAQQEKDCLKCCPCQRSRDKNVLLHRNTSRALISFSCLSFPSPLACLKLIISLPTAQTLQHCKFTLSHTLGRQNEKEEQGQYQATTLRDL